jgi:hypothetical protein
MIAVIARKKIFRMDIPHINNNTTADRDFSKAIIPRQEEIPYFGSLCP